MFVFRCALALALALAGVNVVLAVFLVIVVPYMIGALAIVFNVIRTFFKRLSHS